MGQDINCSGAGTGGVGGGGEVEVGVVVRVSSVGVVGSVGGSVGGSSVRGSGGRYGSEECTNGASYTTIGTGTVSGTVGRQRNQQV